MAKYFVDFVQLKRNLGYKYTTAEYLVREFDTFLISKDLTEPIITKELCDEWMERRENESGSSLVGRATIITEFAKYMGDIGKPCYIPCIPKVKTTGFVAHIFTDDEIFRFFQSCDNLRLRSLKHDSIIIMLPAFFRLLYGTGIRVSEALLLKDKDVNLNENYIVLHDTKSRKNRFVPIAQSLSDVCREYKKYREKLPIKIDKEYFFLSLAGKVCKNHNIVYTWFRTILQDAGIPHNGKHLGPRIHDFRHTFSVHSFVKMSKEGLDMYCSLPVLSMYLGHSSIESTNNYVRLCESMYPELVKKIEPSNLNIYPKLFEDEAN